MALKSSTACYKYLDTSPPRVGRKPTQATRCQYYTWQISHTTGKGWVHPPVRGSFPLIFPWTGSHWNGKKKAFLKEPSDRRSELVNSLLTSNLKTSSNESQDCIYVDLFNPAEGLDSGMLGFILHLGWGVCLDVIWNKDSWQRRRMHDSPCTNLGNLKDWRQDLTEATV